MRHMNRIAS